MSLQVCHCGWSKCTTYHGLRTHQGKMGCTQRGVAVKESEQQQYTWDHVGLTNNQKYFGLDVYAPIKTDYYSDPSLQECHCGWSKVTTYHGLRTHQGMMGCTLKRMRIPKSEPWNWDNQWEEVDQMKHQPAKKVTLKKEKQPLPPIPNSHTISADITGTIKVEYKSLATPQSFSQRATKSEWRDFSNHPQVNRSDREHPTLTYPVKVDRPQKKDWEDQTLSQISDREEMTRNWNSDFRRHSATRYKFGGVAPGE
ncbi:uncharacterized protein LOC119481383 [Sebastes umbrosus]|uniref:uncharacterized protein LOC119481383 n=1 Tax=Sebastes umbrosus TaxID=72105 RepID=UPI00189F9B9F|nr:uncharacterized protein LOC119481383 [Sebastes umbrosus]XP_037614177.1 uncharacterized protein LOC119481383 [Sebastes umbrosus]